MTTTALETTTHAREALPDAALLPPIPGPALRVVPGTWRHWRTWDAEDWCGAVVGVFIGVTLLLAVALAIAARLETGGIW